MTKQQKKFISYEGLPILHEAARNYNQRKFIHIFRLALHAQKQQITGPIPGQAVIAVTVAFMD
jgi:hypothetical protein